MDDGELAENGFLCIYNIHKPSEYLFGFGNGMLVMLDTY